MVRWLPFVWAAILLAATAGFGLGSAALVAFSASLPFGSWWIASAQAHGHLQLFGWAGLMVLGVGAFFLPRLRGANLAAPGVLPWSLALLSTGLALRGMAQPLFALSPLSTASRLALALSGPLELAGATLWVGVLLATFRQGPPLRQRQGLVQIIPYLAVAFVSFWLALATNATLTVIAGLAGTPVISQPGDYLVIYLGLVGFLVPVSVAISARTFPLFLWLRVPSPRWLQVALGAFMLGVILRLAGMLSATPPLSACGKLVEGITFVGFPILLQLMPLRRRPGKTPKDDPHYLRAVEWLLVPAYLWLALAGLLDVLGAAALLGFPVAVSQDAELHALGAGFVTLLILGMGARMLPGFSGRQIASSRLVWATVGLGNSAALLRVAPLLLVGIGGAAFWPFGPPSAGLALSGLLDLAAVVCLALNLRRTFSSRRQEPRAS